MAGYTDYSYQNTRAESKRGRVSKNDLEEKKPDVEKPVLNNPIYMGSREENERAALQVRTVVTPGVCVGGGQGASVWPGELL